MTKYELYFFHEIVSVVQPSEILRGIKGMQFKSRDLSLIPESQRNMCVG